MAGQLNEEERKERWRRVFIVAGLYIAGCLLIYFGVVDAVLGYGVHGQWRLRPHPHLFGQLFWGVLNLLKPLLVGFFLMWLVLIPVGLWRLLVEWIQERRLRSRKRTNTRVATSLENLRD
jgi:hypothetical protein